MGPHKSPYLNHPKSLWLTWFMDGILDSDIDEIGASSLLNYLLDLNLFKFEDDGLLRISQLKQGQSSEKVRSVLLKILSELSETENGFALVYFFPGLSEGEFPALKLDHPSSVIKEKGLFGKKNSTKDKKSSNLSNLQIVKKWGNELRPFLDLEQQTISRLRGTHTSQEDAQWLFRYILDKTRKKSPPKKWEQLSRKRHR